MVGRDGRVAPEILVRRFGPAVSLRPVAIKWRITQLRSDWFEKGENM